MKTKLLLLSKSMLLVCAVAAVTCNGAFAAETPAALAGATKVDAAKAKSLMAEGAIMVDSRVANEYAEAHIKGAICLPYKEKSVKDVSYDPTMDSFDLSKLPANRNAALIFACNGAECWKSYKASKAAIKAGYKRVYWFRDGFPAWKSAGYPVE